MFYLEKMHIYTRLIQQVNYLFIGLGVLFVYVWPSRGLAVSMVPAG
jgi:hypothetical protein